MAKVSEWGGGAQGRDKAGDRVPLRKAFIGWEAKGPKGWVAGFTKGDAVRKAEAARKPVKTWWLW